MNKNFYTGFAQLLFVAGAMMGSVAGQAAVLTPDAALKAALSVSGNDGRLSAPANRNYNLTYTLDAPGDGEAALYVFSSDNNGYLLVSADDNAAPLLGYVDSGRFDADNMPPAMKWWLEQYARQIEFGREVKALAPERPQRAAIAPMVTTMWNQDAPYNAMCPKINDARSMTGCVATAMAQVMKYHQWPAAGQGEHSYYYNGDWISMDFSKLTFDWSRMIDSYADGAGTEREKSAVAQLMYACGVSTDMQYSPVQSGTADVFVASALVDYFNYDMGVRYAERDYFGLLDWEEFIYNQLRDYGPVQYSGSSDLGGHSFVCDGYSTDGYFHFNWGWGGMSDGYFLLTALDPEMQGIGGSTSGFNYAQAVIANIRKPKSNSKMYLNLMMDQGFSISTTKTGDTRPGDQIVVDSRVLNYSIATASGSLGVKFTNEETGEVKYGSSSTRFNIGSLMMLSEYTTQIPSTLRAGTYVMQPVMCGTDGVWKDIPVKLSTCQKIIMTIKGGVCTFAEADRGRVYSDNVTLQTPVYLGNMFHMTATVTNNGDAEFVGTLVPTLASGKQPVAKASSIAIDLLPGESTEIDYTGIFNHFASTSYPDAGTYTLYLLSESNNEIMSKGVEVELHAVPENTVLKTTGFSLEGNTDKVDKSNLVFTAEVECQEGFFGNYLTLVIFPYANGSVSAVGYFPSEYLFVGAGESVVVKAKGAFAAGEPGKKYFAVLFDGQTSIVPSGKEVVFTLDNPASIGEVMADGDDIVRTVVVTIDGRQVLDVVGAADEDMLPKGVYILCSESRDGSVATRKVVR